MRKIRTDRNIVVYVLLTIITCGIYGLWFIYEWAQDVNEICRNDGDETPGLLKLILLSLITCGLYSYYWYYKLGNRLQANGPTYGVTISENGTTVLLWLILGILICGLGQYYGLHLLMKNTNTLATAYNQAYGL
ncbi:MAG: DUF4234 domain-containing protein [Oscillospiraceae bacterium]|nr:DUF4234 domain-containing protein [Oscillospiraceae bacterium]